LLVYLLLFVSVCDVLGKGSFPSNIETSELFVPESMPGAAAAGASANNSGGGFLSFLFEADENYNLDLNIAYAYPGN
jgi:hypothetical protein